MPIPVTVPAAEAAAAITCDALVVGATGDGDRIELTGDGPAIDAALDGVLAAATEHGFKAKVGETLGVPTMGRLPARWVQLVGLGPASEVSTAAIRRASAAAVRGLGGRNEVVLALHERSDRDALEASVEGALLGSYRFGGYKSEPASPETRRLSFVDSEGESIARARSRATATWLARDLVNEPASVLTPTEFARRSEDVAGTSGLGCEILAAEQLRERGFGGILAVAQGSSEPPCLVVLRYEPSGSNAGVGLVGKGITFDSGGYSIKPAASMESMKTDMGGAAAILGAMSALGDLGIEENVSAYLACSENMVSGNALRPGDVIRHYGGRTTEVVNTDAEGRLVLADALALAAENGHDPIVDVATLTGSIHVALGSGLTGLFYNDERLRDAIEEAGAGAGEPMWRMPIVEDYRSTIESDVADMRNQGTRYGGASIAALFLRESVGSIPWAHLDIAGTGRASADKEEITKGGTGVGARTLLRWLEARAAAR